MPRKQTGNKKPPRKTESKKNPEPKANIAESLASKQREISVSEFFSKNRHLLGFDNPKKALLTVVKEAVDNSLDACEEAGKEVVKEGKISAETMEILDRPLFDLSPKAYVDELNSFLDKTFEMIK